MGWGRGQASEKRTAEHLKPLEMRGVETSLFLANK